MARDLTEAMRTPLGGRSIIIENIGGGAGGALGATKVACTPNGGYTRRVHRIVISAAPALYRTRQDITLDDFGA